MFAGFTTLLARTFLLERIADPRAGEALSVAVARSPDSGGVPAELASALEHARNKSELHTVATEQRLLRLLPAELASVLRARLARFAPNSSRLLH